MKYISNFKSDLIQKELIEEIQKVVRRWRSNDSIIEIIITGIPNTGKSSLVNNMRLAHIDSFRQKVLCLAGDKPAVTRVRAEMAF